MPCGVLGVSTGDCASDASRGALGAGAILKEDRQPTPLRPASDGGIGSSGSCACGDCSAALLVLVSFKED